MRELHDGTFYGTVLLLLPSNLSSAGGGIVVAFGILIGKRKQTSIGINQYDPDQFLNGITKMYFVLKISKMTAKRVRPLVQTYEC